MVKVLGFVATSVNIIVGLLTIWGAITTGAGPLDPRPFISLPGLLASAGWVLVIIVVTLLWNARQREAAGNRLDEVQERCRAVASDDDTTDDQVQEAVVAACQTIAEVFRTIKRRKCRVSVKALEYCVASDGSDVHAYVVDVARNRYGATPRDGTVKHWVLSNTDFWELLSQWEAGLGKPATRLTYLANNLPWLYDYRNTSIDYEQYEERLRQRGLPVYDALHRMLRWPLPYRSTVVAAIAPPEGSSEGAKDRIAGFLCVDCRIPGVFRRGDRALLKRAASYLLPAMEAKLDRAPGTGAGGRVA